MRKHHSVVGRRGGARGDRVAHHDGGANRRLSRCRSSSPASGLGDGANLGGLAGARRALPDARRGGRAGRRHLARLPQHTGAERGQRARTGSAAARGTPTAAGGRSPPTSAGSTATPWSRLGWATPSAKMIALTEQGNPVNGVGDSPNQHDILTGSQPDGRAYTDDADHTCGNWTGNGEGSARSATRIRRAAATARGTRPTPAAAAARRTWSAPEGAGLFYCFAVD